MRISKKTAKSQSILTGKINIITVISLIFLVLVDMYMLIVLKISCKPIVEYTFEVIIIVLAISFFSYNQRTNKYFFKIIKWWTSVITFLLGVYFKDIFELIIEFIKIYAVRDFILIMLIMLPVIIEIIGFIISLLRFILWKGYELELNEKNKIITIHKKHAKANRLLGNVIYTIDDKTIFANLNTFYSSKRVMDYEKIFDELALKEIIEELNKVAEIEECTKISICCDRYAPELQCKYGFKKIIYMEKLTYYERDVSLHMK